MAIRMSYQTGAGLMGAYAAGQAAAQRRSQKYILDRWEEERRRQQRLQEIGLRAGARNRLGAAGGRMVDPVAALPEGLREQRSSEVARRMGYGPMSRVHQQAQMKAAQRRARMGLAPRGEASFLLPRFERAETEQEFRERMAEEADERRFGEAEEARKFQAENAVEMEELRQAGQQQGREFGAEQMRELQRSGRAVDYVVGLTDTIQEQLENNQHPRTPQVRGHINKVMRDAHAIMNDPKIPEERREQLLQGVTRALEDIQSKARPVPSLDELLEKETIERDGNRLQRNEQGQWEVIRNWESPASRAAEQQKAAAEQAMTRLKEAKAVREKWLKDRLAIAKEMAGAGMEAGYKDPSPHLERAGQILAAGGFPEPPDPGMVQPGATPPAQAGGQAPPEPDGYRRDYERRAGISAPQTAGVQPEPAAPVDPQVEWARQYIQQVRSTPQAALDPQVRKRLEEAAEILRANRR